MVIYCDPPYVDESRSGGAAYVHEMQTEAAHRALAEALHDTPATVLLSGYPSDLYDDLYGDWTVSEALVVRSASNRAGTPRPRATEVVWSNRPLSGQLVFA